MNKNNLQYTNNESLSTSNYSEDEPLQPHIPEDEEKMSEKDNNQF